VNREGTHIHAIPFTWLWDTFSSAGQFPAAPVRLQRFMQHGVEQTTSGVGTPGKAQF